VTQLSQTTQQNAADSEELAATAEQMSGHSKHLRETISFFKVSSETTDNNADNELAARKAEKKRAPRSERAPGSAAFKTAGNLALAADTAARIQ
jgi:methyl-accepting chemotaxis protein